MAEEGGGSSDEEKTEEPSQHRIDKFRKRGEVASSKELVNVLVLAACLGTLGLSMVYMYETISNYIHWLYTLDVAYAYSDKAIRTILYQTVITAVKCIAPVLFAAFSIGITGYLIQVGFLFAPEVLELKFDRINPVNGIKRLFSMRALVEALKGIFKFAIIGLIVYLFVKDDLNIYRGFLHMDLAGSFIFAKNKIIMLGFMILLGLFVVAMGDFIYQKMKYLKKLKQGKSESKRELKEQEGNPEVKQKIRAIQREMAQKRMMKDVQTADVIVTNPTHISIGLKYDAEKMISPIIIAKGADHIALKIREIAKEHNIPIVENVPLARTLYSTVKVYDVVPRTLYKTVAEVLAFVYKLKKKR